MSRPQPRRESVGGPARGLPNRPMNGLLNGLLNGLSKGLLHGLLMLAPLAASGCASPGAEDDEAGTGDDGELAAELGDTPLPACEAAVFAFEQIVAEAALASPDPSYIAELYRGEPPDLSGESPTPGGSALQRWVREVGASLGRVEAGLLSDDAAIEASLVAALEDDSGELAKAAAQDVVARLRLVASLDVRSRLATVSEVLPDPTRSPALLHEQWDQAWCVWDGMLRPLAVDADVRSDEGWESLIVDAFTSGHAGIVGPEQPWAPDDTLTKPAKQIAEKGSFAVVHRLVLAHAEQAASSGEAEPAREALGLVAIIEDRIRDRNTPAVEQITTMLSGPPADIDVDLLEHELAIAFIKRARKYCDEAVEAGALGTASGIKGAWEGIIYTQVVLPVMRDRLADTSFDAEAYMRDWDAYLEAIIADDAAAAVELADELVEWNCAAQAELGIASCTASADESE